MLSFRLVLIPAFILGFFTGYLIRNETRLVKIIIIIFTMFIAFATILRFCFDLELIIGSYIRKNSTAFKWLFVESTFVFTFACFLARTLKKGYNSIAKRAGIIIGLICFTTILIFEGYYLNPINKLAKKFPEKVTSDCGIYCIKYILRLKGINADYAEILDRARITRLGMTPDDIMEVINSYNLKSEFRKVPFQQLRYLAPCILLVDSNHYIVLEKISGNFCKVLDINSSVKYIKADNLKKQYDGKAIVVKR